MFVLGTYEVLGDLSSLEKILKLGSEIIRLTSSEFHYHRFSLWLLIMMSTISHKFPLSWRLLIIISVPLDCLSLWPPNILPIHTFWLSCHFNRQWQLGRNAVALAGIDPAEQDALFIASSLLRPCCCSCYLSCSSPARSSLAGVGSVQTTPSHLFSHRPSSTPQPSSSTQPLI